MNVVRSKSLLACTEETQEKRCEFNIVSTATTVLVSLISRDVEMCNMCCL